MNADPSLTIVIIDASENILEKLRTIRGKSGNILVVFPSKIAFDEMTLRPLFIELRSLNKERMLTLASKNARLRKLALKAEWNAIGQVRHLRALLENRPEQDEALRVFSPRFWHGHIRTHLQSIGLISLPNVRIWMLFGTSLIVFLFIVFRILPSATVSIWPAQDTVSQTVNVYLISSGALSIPRERVRTLPLIPLTVKVDRTMTFDEIGKQFTGKNATVIMTIYNDSAEQYSLRKGTRFVNQAGMVFRLKVDVILKPKTRIRAKTVADEQDQYGEIIGARGNVPAGIKWEIPALPDDYKQLIYGRNDQVGIGGTTSYTNVLQKEDLEVAKKKLEQDLLVAAKQLADDQRVTMNQEQGGSFVQLSYDELTRSNYVDITLPEEFVGQHVQSVPVSGTMYYTVLLYDENKLFSTLQGELTQSTSTDRVLIPSSIQKQNLVIHVIDAPWDAPIQDWVKMTVDLSGTERYILDPLTPSGALFAKKVRDAVSGKSIEDAERIVKNFPEVAKVKVSIWPFWNTVLPALTSNISIREVNE